MKMVILGGDDAVRLSRRSPALPAPRSSAPPGDAVSTLPQPRSSIRPWAEPAWRALRQRMARPRRSTRSVMPASPPTSPARRSRASGTHVSAQRWRGCGDTSPAPVAMPRSATDHTRASDSLAAVTSGASGPASPRLPSRTNLHLLKAVPVMPCGLSRCVGLHGAPSAATVSQWRSWPSGGRSPRQLPNPKPPENSSAVGTRPTKTPPGAKRRGRVTVGVL